MSEHGEHAQDDKENLPKQKPEGQTAVHFNKMNIDMTDAMETVMTKLADKNEEMLLDIGNKLTQKLVDKFQVMMTHSFLRDHNTVNTVGQQVVSHNVEYSAGKTAQGKDDEDDSISLAESMASRLFWVHPRKAVQVCCSSAPRLSRRQY